MRMSDYSSIPDYLVVTDADGAELAKLKVDKLTNLSERFVAEFKPGCVFYTTPIWEKD